MPSTEIIGIITAVGIAAGLIATAFSSILKSFAEFRAAITRVDAKADVIAATVAKVDGHVNSEKTASEGREAAAKLEIALLREMLSKEERTAALLAQSKAGASTTVVHTTNGGVKPSGPAEQSLEKIEDHTEAIETNTARTVEDVQDLKDKA